VAIKEIKTKTKQRFRAEEVLENNTLSIKTKSGKMFHKSDLRQ